MINEYNEYNEDDDIIKNNEFINYLDIDLFHMEEIPANVSISTMSLACYLGTLFKTDNIYKYMILESNYIVAVKSSKGMRCIEEYKGKFKSTKKNSGKNFFNQNTIIIHIIEDRFLNIKLFKNGSIQMTGCKFLSDVNIAINKLIFKLKEKLIVKIDNIMNEITFVDDPNSLYMSKFKIDLINSNFGVTYLINKENLFNILSSKNILCRLSSQHSCVNIKYKVKTKTKPKPKPKTKTKTKIDTINTIESINTSESIDSTLIEIESYVSIFVFQTGNIIITGAKKAEHVKDAYFYIVYLLNQNKKNIMKKDISKILTIEDINEILNFT
jgi:TATA-box binding protein (TBP) (component of TFIID and TFIIIB)